MSNNIFHGKSNVSDEQAQSLKIEQETANSYYINDTVGAIGSAYNFSMTGEFDSAEISFEFDSDLLLDPDFDPVIYWFDEEEQELVPLTTTVTGSVASAEVEHFSMYILTNRTEYLDSFTWYDTFTRTNYSNIKSVFVISDCESLGSGVNGQNIDTTYRRLDYARQIAASLPTSSLTMTIKYGDYIFSYEEGMYNPGDINTHINTLNFQTNITDNQDSLPDNVVRFAINHYLSDTNDNCMKIVFLITDGKANHEIHQFTLDAIAQNNVRVFTVDIGSNTQAKLEYLKHFAEVSNGYYCDATQTGGIQKLIDQMQLYYSFGTDSDLDGIPDDYEDSLILFNGKSIVTDKNDSDTDDDNLSDGEEVRLEITHDPDENHVTFIGKLFSDPTSDDGDNDGDFDSIDPNPLDYQLNGYFIVQLKRLYHLAEEYPHLPDIAGLFSTNMEDWLTFMFIRYFQLGSDGSRRYADMKWAVTAGDMDYGFIEYVRINNPSLYHYFETTPYIYAYSHQGLSPETWETIDLYHMAGTISALIYLSDREIDIFADLTKFATGFMTLFPADSVYLCCGVDIMKYVVQNKLQSENFVDNILGWAGDVRSLMNDVIEYDNNPYNIDSFDGFYCSFVDLFGQDGYSFSYEDLYGDIDSYNLFNFNGTDTMVSKFDKYYGNQNNVDYRFHTFVKGKSLQEFNEFVEPYTKNYYIDEGLSIIIEHYCTDEQIEAAKCAFSAIIFNLMNSEEL